MMSQHNDIVVQDQPYDIVVVLWSPQRYRRWPSYDSGSKEDMVCASKWTGKTVVDVQQTLRMRIRLNYVANGAPVVEQAEVNNFPTIPWQWLGYPPCACVD